jgi:hypothetical protein
MADETIIAWTDHTFNAWMGCTKVSEGCRNCYAETLTTNRMGLKLWGPDAKRQVTKSPWQNVDEWNAPRRGGHAGNYGHRRRRRSRRRGRRRTGRRTVRATFTPHLVFTGSLMDWAEDRRDLDRTVREACGTTIRSSSAPLVPDAHEAAGEHRASSCRPIGVRTVTTTCGSAPPSKTTASPIARDT